MMKALVDRLRALSPGARAKLFAMLAKEPGALSDVRFDFQNFWARLDQIVTPEEIRRNRIIVFTGPRGSGKTESAVQTFNREILAGRAQRPRIFAANEADVDKAVVHGVSGIMACLPRAERPRWISNEGPAGVLRYRNGIECICFTVRSPEGAVAHAGDLDLYDDVAKWGAHAARAWAHAYLSCRIGVACRLVATTRRGIELLRNLLKASELDGVLIKRPADLRANRFNLSPKLFGRATELEGYDLVRQELDDEDISTTSPFSGIDFDSPPVRILEAQAGSFAQIVVAVDPADGKGGQHDDWGIGAAGRRHDRHIVGLEDATGQYDDAEAAEVVLRLCDTWGARVVVVERNRGERRIANVLQAVHYRRQYESGSAAVRPLPEIIGVTARDQKQLRAGPLRGLYLQGLLHHMGAGLGALERQQREWDPDGPRRPRQDDRIDWWVHAVHFLAELGDGEGRAPTLDEIEGLADRVRKIQGGQNAAPHDMMARSDRVSAEDPRSSFRAKSRHVTLSRRGVL